MNPPSGTPSSPCYYCGDPVDVRLMVAHAQHCGAVLVECPEKCGSYVPRRAARSHRRNCVGMINAESNIIPSRSAISVAPARHEAAWRDNVSAALNLLRSSVADGERDRQSVKQIISMIAHRLETEATSVDSLRQTTVDGLREAGQRSAAVETGLRELDEALSRVEERVRRSLDAVAHRLETLERSAADEGTAIVRTTNCETELRDLKRFVAKESAIVGDLWESQSKRFNDLKLELEIRCKISRELENKQDVLSEKIDMIVEEMRNRAEEMAGQGGSLKKLKSTIKEVCAVLEELVERDLDREGRTLEPCVCRQGSVCGGSTKGRLLWRIDRYKEKMTEAKENGTVVRSPVFLSKDYGYALRMELFLHGRGRWKGRHVIGCLRVVEGPWDPLLDWPCVLRAAVTLRDQDNPANDIRKIVRSRSIGLDEGSEGLEKDKGLDMFIPHTSLTRHDGFTKHDALFVDIQVTRSEGNLSASSIVG